MGRRWHEFFQDFDVLICPPAPSAAFPHKTEPFPERTLRVNGKELPYGDQTFWSAYFSVEYKDVAAFAVLIVVLIFLPTGILGRPETEKV